MSTAYAENHCNAGLRRAVWRRRVVDDVAFAKLRTNPRLQQPQSTAALHLKANLRVEQSLLLPNCLPLGTQQLNRLCLLNQVSIDARNGISVWAALARITAENLELN